MMWMKWNVIQREWNDQIVSNYREHIGNESRDKLSVILKEWNDWRIPNLSVIAGLTRILIILAGVPCRKGNPPLKTSRHVGTSSSKRRLNQNSQESLSVDSCRRKSCEKYIVIPRKCIERRISWEKPFNRENKPCHPEERSDEGSQI